jgi:pimeloyl-ACP methyl ester carboxylesterase
MGPSPAVLPFVLASLYTYTMAGVAHETVSANGLRFHVASAGPPEAPLLLCLHGFPECWYSWRHVLERLAGPYRIVAPDLRGFGETEKPPGGYDLDTLAADVAGIARALGRERIYLAGHDWGGAVAYHAAACYPGLIERLAVLNCPHPLAARRILLNPRQLARFWYFLFFLLPFLPERYLARQGGRAIAGSFKAYAVRKDRITREDRDVFRRAMLRPGAIRAGLSYYRSAPRSFVRADPRWARVAAPTLVLWGLGDGALGPELTHGMERWFTGPLRLEYLPGVGHWTQQEAPDEVCAALRSFFPISL